MPIPDRFYQHTDSDSIRCGSCWNEEIRKTREGDYTGDECVFQSDLELLPTGEAYQCDECLEQSPEYDDLGEEL